jgi:anti-sigma-K factor RskA
VTPRERSGRQTGHEQLEELAVGYVMHALEPEEEARFTAHLASCAACERAVREHEETLAELAHAAPAVDPPPAVLEGIRAAIAPEHLDRGAEAPAADLSSRRDRQVVVVERRWLLAAAAAVSAVVLGLGGWAAVLQGDRAAQTARGDRLAQAVAALESPDARAVRLAGDDGRVQAVVVAAGGRLSVVVDGLEPNPEGTVYVLWGQDRSGDVRAVAAFDVPRTGLDVLPGGSTEVPIEELQVLMVTRERGSTAPAQAEAPVIVSGSV